LPEFEAHRAIKWAPEECHGFLFRATRLRQRAVSVRCLFARVPPAITSIPVADVGREVLNRLGLSLQPKRSQLPGETVGHPHAVSYHREGPPTPLVDQPILTS